MVKDNAAIRFVRLTDISPEKILAHMSDARVAKHLPLMTRPWDDRAVTEFIAAKEACWRRDGLGYWAILHDGAYVGWGGFQKEGDEWDFGLVLKPESFGLGPRIAREALRFAAAADRIPFVTFLLPPSRQRLGALRRLGATFVGETAYGGAAFLKFRIETDKQHVV